LQQPHYIPFFAAPLFANSILLLSTPDASSKIIQTTRYRCMLTFVSTLQVVWDPWLPHHKHAHCHVVALQA
jgi:hypothetical protein